MKIKSKILLTVILLVVLGIFYSCSDEAAVNNNNNQGTSGPTSTPIGTPVGTPVTAAIGSSGGSIMSADSSFELIIPAGALGSITNITVQPLTNFCFNGHGNAVRLTPDGQQFSQPVTIKFHYSQEVQESTFDILMGIARQDPSGYWHYFNNVSNDTINRVISVTLDQFGYPADNNSGGGDVSFFDIAHLEPRSTSLRINETANMTVTYAAVPGEGGDDALHFLPKPIDTWSVNGVPNGNTTFGTILNRHDQSAVFKAPAGVPSPAIVQVGALVNTRINHRGRVVEQFLLHSNVRIRPDTIVFDLKINLAANWFGFAGYPCVLKDGVDMVVTANTNSVSITNVFNQFPNVVPPSGNLPGNGGTVTWIPGNDAGLINVQNVSGTLFMQGTVQWMNLSFTHTGTKNPLFHVVPANGSAYWLGGEPTAGLPSSIVFVNRDSLQSYEDPNNYFTATLTPRR